MKVWVLTFDLGERFAPLVHSRVREMKMFELDGKPLTWKAPAHATVFIEPGQKKPKARANISGLHPGALVLDDKAKGVLENFLSRFGQFLPLDVDGQREWFYQVTNLVDCIDLAASVKRPSGSLRKETFDAAKVPTQPALFKDRLTAAAHMYANDSARVELEELIAGAELTGASFVEPGEQRRLV